MELGMNLANWNQFGNIWYEYTCRETIYLKQFKLVIHRLRSGI